jgi:hypothetical protein
MRRPAHCASTTPHRANIRCLTVREPLMSRPVGTSILLVATATKWLGVVRMPRPLAKAGFDVSLLIPKGSLAEKSRFVNRIGHLADNATPNDWIYAFSATVKATAPRIVLPCDDTALRLMMMLTVAPPPAMQPTLHLQLAALIADSLGDPAFYRASMDKTLICTSAEAFGVRVPPYLVVADPREAEGFIARHGFPIVVKRNHSTAGDRLAICRDRAEFAQEFTRLMAPPALDFDDFQPGRVLLQAHIPGRIHFYAAAAWKGSLLSGVAVEKLEGEPKGPTSVVRYHRSPAMREMTSRLTRGFGLTGIFSPEFVVHERTGEPYLLELKRRMSHGTHRGAEMNVDACAALYAAMRGTPPSTRADLDDGEEHLCAHFPSEWIRDADSRWLRECPVDVPWDEPELFEAMVREVMRGNARGAQ